MTYWDWKYIGLSVDIRSVKQLELQGQNTLQPNVHKQNVIHECLHQEPTRNKGDGQGVNEKTLESNWRNHDLAYAAPSDGWDENIDTDGTQSDAPDMIGDKAKVLQDYPIYHFACVVGEGTTWILSDTCTAGRRQTML